MGHNTRSIATIVGAALLATACDKMESMTPQERPQTETVPGMIYFSKPSIAASVETRVTDTEQENGTYTSKFDESDEICVYSFYNYYYEKNGESIVFENQKVTVKADKSLKYEPLRAWTFSTIYGTAPFVLQSFAFYPYPTPTNGIEIALSNTTTDPAIFSIEYAPSSTPCDLMVAKKTLEKSTATDFRDFILGQGQYEANDPQVINLQFERVLGGLTFRLSKHDDVSEQITITGIEVFYNTDNNDKLVLNTNNGTFHDTDGSLENNYTWEASDDVTNVGSVSMAVGSDEVNRTLQTTKFYQKSEAESGASSTVTYEKKIPTITAKPQFFFAPGTKISKIVFTYTQGTEAGKKHTWHPHVNPIRANENISLRFELDPGRQN